MKNKKRIFFCVSAGVLLMVVVLLWAVGKRSTFYDVTTEDINWIMLSRGQKGGEERERLSKEEIAELIPLLNAVELSGLPVFAASPKDKGYVGNMFRICLKSGEEIDFSVESTMNVYIVNDKAYKAGANNQTVSAIEEKYNAFMIAHYGHGSVYG